MMEKIKLLIIFCFAILTVEKSQAIDKQKGGSWGYEHYVVELGKIVPGTFYGTGLRSSIYWKRFGIGTALFNAFDLPRNSELARTIGYEKISYSCDLPLLFHIVLFKNKKPPIVILFDNSNEPWACISEGGMADEKSVSSTRFSVRLLFGITQLDLSNESHKIALFFPITIGAGWMKMRLKGFDITTWEAYQIWLNFNLGAIKFD